MQPASLEQFLPRSAELIPFPETVMGGSKALKPAPVPPAPPAWWQKYGSIIAVAVAIIVPLALHYADSSDKSLDDKIDDHISDKLQPINKQLTDLTAAVANIRGLMGQVASLKDESTRLKAVIRLQSPDRTLRAIRTEIAAARDNGQRVPLIDVADFKDALHVISPAMPQYWETVAAVINYQSYVNQRAGIAPNPRLVSRPCLPTTYGTLNMQNDVLQGCIVTFGGITNLDNVTFVDSVIRYEGNPISLHNVRFVNCNFILDVKAKPTLPTKKTPLLLALLDSPDQKSISVR